MMKKWVQAFFWTSALGSAATSASAYDGHMGIDFSFSTESANVGLYSLRESPDELTKVGGEYFFNKDDDNFLDAFGSISRKGFANDPNFELGLKGKVFYTKHDNYDQSGYGVMIGATSRYWLPTEVPVTIAGDVLFAPDVVTFDQVEGAFEVEVRTEVQILPSAFAYVGYRKLDVSYKSGSKDLDGLIHLGVNIGF